MGLKETAILAGGCFWGMQELVRRFLVSRVHASATTAATLPMPLTAITARMPRRSKWYSIRRSSVIARCWNFLPDSRSQHAQPAGQRKRVVLPFRHLLHYARAAADRAGNDCRRRRLGPVAGQGGHRSQTRRPLLAGRAGAPGLSATSSEWLHLPLSTPAVEAPRWLHALEGCPWSASARSRTVLTQRFHDERPRPHECPAVASSAVDRCAREPELAARAGRSRRRVQGYFCFQHGCPGCHSHGFPTLKSAG